MAHGSGTFQTSDGSSYKCICQNDKLVKVIRTEKGSAHYGGDVYIFTLNSAGRVMGPNTYHTQKSIKNYMIDEKGETVGFSQVAESPDDAFYARDGTDLNATKEEWENYATPY